MNSNLYNKEEKLTADVLENLQNCFNQFENIDKNTNGYKRNQELRKSGVVTYQQLKRIKNFFDNYQGQHDEAPYILNGGDYMKNWVNRILNSWRDNDERSKEIKSIVQPNQYIKPHNKKGDLRNTGTIGDSHSSALGYFNLEVTESLKRINEIIQKII